jgi:hypothetical protein
VVGDDPLLSPRRQRRARLREGHQGALRPGLLPGHERSAGQHEPARRPRRQDTR